MKTDTLRTAEQIPQQSTMRIPADSRIPDAEHLRMYTEEEVSSMLQVSLSQLRKWRMKAKNGRCPGPPFRKVGRLVRYPERALRVYIDGE